MFVCAKYRLRALELFMSLVYKRALKHSTEETIEKYVLSEVSEYPEVKDTFLQDVRRSGLSCRLYILGQVHEH